VSKIEENIEELEKKLEELKNKKVVEKKEEPNKAEELKAKIKELEKKQANTYEAADVMPKKTAAVEIHNLTKNHRALAGGLFVAPFLTLLVGTFYQPAGSIFAGITAMGAAYFMFRDTQYMNYLRNKYNLK